MAGLTAYGFETLRLQQLVARMEQRLREEFGDVDLAPESPFGQIVGIMAEEYAVLWDQLANVYSSQYPSTASGVSLDLAVDINGITRQQAAPTSVYAIATGDEGTLIPSGSIAENSVTGNRYSTLENQQVSRTNAHRFTITVGEVTPGEQYTLTINQATYSATAASGSTPTSILNAIASQIPAGLNSEVNEDGLFVEADDPTETMDVNTSGPLEFFSVGSPLEFFAVESGPIPLPVGQLDTIVTARVGWTEIENLVPGAVGRNIENDGQLRLRRAQSVRLQARGPLDAILASVLNVNGVVDATAYENNETATTPDGLPPGHVWVVVQGGLGADIATAIARNIAAGTGTYGAQSGTVTSPISGAEYVFNFDRPTITPLYLTLNISTTEGFPTGGIGAIRDALVAYGSTLGIGDDLRVSRLYTPINSVQGFYVDALAVGRSPNPSEGENVEASRDERFDLSASNIVINVEGAG